MNHYLNSRCKAILSDSFQQLLGLSVRGLRTQWRAISLICVWTLSLPFTFGWGLRSARCLSGLPIASKEIEQITRTALAHKDDEKPYTGKFDADTVLKPTTPYGQRRGAPKTG